MNSLTDYFSSENFMPHGHCYLWEPALLWLHVVSDTLIALAYFTIPVTLIYFVKRRTDLQFHWMFTFFAIFILACGVSHVMEIWTVWHPDYWLAGLIKAITAIASIPTAYLLAKLMPLALALPSPAALAASNAQLRIEIDDRVRIEQLLGQKNLELAALNEELRAFSYSVSHDLRAPLRSMDGFSLALLEDYDTQLDTNGKDALQRIRLASQRMGRLIDDLLRLSQVGRTEFQNGHLDLTALCTGIAALLEQEAPDRQVQWQIQDHMQIWGDRALLQVALQNLIENAWKFTGKTENPQIRIGTIEQAEKTIYFIADNGAGFDMANKEKIFGTFQRLHLASDFPGTGIGLALVQRVVQRHHGRIWAEASVGQGATFYFCVNQDTHDTVD